MVNKTLHLHPLLWSAFAALIAIAISLTPQWQLIERKGYDLLSAYTAPDAADLPIVIVGIDEPSFAELNLQWPWPRGLHAELLDQLRLGGAAAAVFDIVFAEPSDPEQDRLFADSIEKAGKVVLASDVSYLQTAQYEQLMLVEPLEQFLLAGAQSGLARVEIDADLVVRNLPTSAETLWRVTLKQLAEGGDSSSSPPPDGMIRYWHPTPGISYASYYQALNADSMLPAGFFRDKIVLIGLYLGTSTDPDQAGADTFVTPYILSKGSLTPGVEIHANLVADGLTKRFIQPLSPWLSWGVLIIVIIAASWGMRCWRPVHALLLMLGLMGQLLALEYWLFAGKELFLPLGSAILALALLYLMRGAVAFLREVQQRKAIRRSFEHYVAPSIVQQLIDEPERLRLSGEYFDTTVIFTDLVGFTSITEKMDPLELRGLLNRYFSRMVDAMLANQGTLDKFIGDAMMCFYGVPIENPQHPLQAVRTAWAMKRSLRELNREWGRQGLPELGMRIGVNSGRVVAGNMGTENLFNYTIMGDCVNTGARLEGANKFYGTEIIVGESTQPQVKDEFELRKLDLIRVKGKQQPIAIYELLGPRGEVEQDLLACRSLYEAALQLYLDGNFTGAETDFRKILAIYEDSASKVLAERCAQLKAEPPEDWLGVYTWTSK